MERIYTPERIETLRKKAGKAAWTAAVLAGTALLACIALCIGIRTANADLRRILVILISACGSAAAVFLLERIRLPALREAAHEEGVLKETPEVYQGIIMDRGTAFSIPKSITFLPVKIQEEGKEIALKLNAEWADRFPLVGSALQAEARRGYIVAWEALPGLDLLESGGETLRKAETLIHEAADFGSRQRETPSPDVDGSSSRQRGGAGRQKVKAVLWSSTRRGAKKGLSFLPRVAVCLAAGALFWSWVFTFLTDASPAEKVTLFANMLEGRWKELSVRLEEEAPEGIRFIQAHPFSYALMDSTALSQADLYIMTPAQAEEYAEWVVPGTERMIYDAGSDEGAAKEYLHYAERLGEDWYLYFGAGSQHTGETDEAAKSIAEILLKLP